MSGIERLFSIAILTYQRNDRLVLALESILPIRDSLAQVIVVDNASEPPAAAVCGNYPWVTLVRAPRNIGAAGRNLAFEQAKSEFLITLDDDVLGITEEHLSYLTSEFASNDIAAINFRVIEDRTGRLVNWVHHRDAAIHATASFDTYEITEGAVAFRMEAIKQVGGYPLDFFLSHEGPDLAFRLINHNWRVVFRPGVEVRHSFAPQGRASWRNYYYDTRNAFWLACRNLPLGYGLAAVVRQVGGMLLLSIRDGYLLTWLNAVCHGILGLRRALRQRDALSANAMKCIRDIDSFRPHLFTTLRKRLSSRIGSLES